MGYEVLIDSIIAMVVWRGNNGLKNICVKMKTAVSKHIFENNTVAEFVLMMI
jgi:hypothetical protein